ncbi:anaerobic ribonucleoside-triphosphate reductase activating protein [Natronincola ferrireducens]|uniref:Pyruvate formate lyase activating enzyme n=1 Tax=Natronincola ferrireducens TaxID=393762 RepID=A0A1G8ZPB2_9FIRM|nr:anaerobic ribonucleoside-triphosphate reductase activating protein [Natronincola ferrireducens]SDK16205.1 pyruvate formate lyase activating enzyme [Natronincola ferrireducens]
MKIIAMEKSSFIDYPGKICTMYFVALCNFKCGYCHNASIVKGEGEVIPEEEVFSFLEKRKKFIDAVCISGGEPTLYKELYDFIKKVKDKGFFIKLDTNGTNPQILKKLIDEKLIDYVAMDIKAPFHKYESVTQTKVDIESIKSSIDIIRSAPIDYEFRTTICRELLTKEDVLEMATYLKGSKRFYLQNFQDGDTVLAGRNQFHPYDVEVLKEIQRNLEGYFELCEVRNK